MLMFQNTTSLSWPLPLTPHVGRQPPFICTIGEAALFVEDEIRLGLADDKLWRQRLKKFSRSLITIRPMVPSCFRQPE